jgi:putative hemolysin
VTDRRAALVALPPLLRTYLAMGGWVSDHAVVDRQLNTLHVFTCVEVDKVPAARAASLRAVAG